MNDLYANHPVTLVSPATRLHEVAPSDTLPLPIASRAITCDTDGYVRVTTVGGDTGCIYMAAGVPFPIRATFVHATGTTAGGIVSLA